MLPKGMAPNPQLPIETILRGAATGAGSTYAAAGTLNTANGMLALCFPPQHIFLHCKHTSVPIWLSLRLK